MTYPNQTEPYQLPPGQPPGSYPPALYQPLQYPPVPYERPSGNGLAIAGMVCGIASIPFFWWGAGTLALVVCGLTFGIIGHRRANRLPYRPNRGMAIAAWVCAIFGAVGYLCFGVATVGVGFIL